MPDLESEIQSYARKHLIAHLIAGGKSNESIEEILMELPRNTSWQDIVSTYVETLPEAERDAAKQRLGVL